MIGQILGDNLKNFWEENNYLAKLDIINLEIQIKTAKGDYSPYDKEEFQTQIFELLELKVIRPSSSRHRRIIFMVRNHSEIKKGKTRMVINYKRLNDNTYDDQYKILDKDMLINCIKDVKSLTNLIIN